MKCVLCEKESETTFEVCMNCNEKLIKHAKEILERRRSSFAEEILEVAKARKRIYESLPEHSTKNYTGDNSV